MSVIKIGICILSMGTGLILSSCAETQDDPRTPAKEEVLPLTLMHAPGKGEPEVEPEKSFGYLYGLIWETRLHMCNRSYHINRQIIHECEGGGRRVEVQECEVIVSGTFPRCDEQQTCRVIDEGECSGGTVTMGDGGDSNGGGDDGGDDDDGGEVDSDPVAD